MQPVYLVCGLPRTGTSMMMRAVEAGGLPCIYDPADDAVRNTTMGKDGYVPSPNGFFELNTHSQYQKKSWAEFAGKCLKVMHGEIHKIPHGHPTRSIYMVRDIQEIKASWRLCMIGEETERTWDFLDHYEKKVQDAVSLLGNRGNVKVFNYSRVITEPIECFETTFWPIDVIKAAATVDPKLYRNRNNARACSTEI